MSFEQSTQQIYRLMEGLDISMKEISLSCCGVNIG